MKILVTGATGFLGQALVPALLAAGHEVIFPPRVGDNAADLRQPESYRPWVAGVDVVIHLAAFNPRGWSLNSLNKAKLIDLNAHATGALGRIAAEVKVRHFLFASSARVYGIDQSPYSEQSPLMATDSYGRAKILAESALENAAFGTGMVLNKLRLPMVTGKPGGVAGLAARLAGLGLPLPCSLVKARKSVLDRAFFIECVLKLLALRQPGTFNIANRQPVTLEILCQDMLGHNPKRFNLPRWCQTALFGLPWLGYSIGHAFSECVLDTKKFGQAIEKAE